jgi:hypothetical protein
MASVSGVIRCGRMSVGIRTCAAMQEFALKVYRSVKIRGLNAEGGIETSAFRVVSSAAANRQTARKPRLGHVAVAAAKPPIWQ